MIRFTLALLVLAACSAPAVDGAQETAEFFEGREANLRRDTGWLSLIGLFRLDEGTQTIGSAADAALVLPDRHPAVVGTLTVDGDRVSFAFASGVEGTIDGEPARDAVLASDDGGDPSVVDSGSLQFYVIGRNAQLYLRVKDRRAPLLDSFEGVERWDYDPALRVEARYVHHDEPHTLHVPDVLGGGEDLTCDGYFEFDLQGRTCTLEATYRGDDRWSFIYADATSGDESYGGGRFLYFDAPGNSDRVVLDFNQSYNPPCVFTPYSTCPLPPEGNRLPVAVRGGEKMWSGHR